MTSETKESMHTHLATRGLTYKVDVVVDKVKTRALLDPGAQISLARWQLLPVVKERNNWTKEQCQSRNLELDGQPRGAGSHLLGAKGIVALQVTIRRKDWSSAKCTLLHLRLI